MRKGCRRLLTVLTIASVSSISAISVATDKKGNPEADRPPEARQGAESLDLTMYQRIREEGLLHSHIMEYASALFDGIGQRLTGSTNMKKANDWTRDQFAAMGCVNAHLEDWGEFGMGWQQRNTWAHMVSPDTAVLIAQAVPWSPATSGPLTASLVAVTVQDEKDFDKYKGKLEGKIVLLGKPSNPGAGSGPLFSRLDDKELAQVFQWPLDNDFTKEHVYSDEFFEQAFKQINFREKIGQFLATEKAAAAIVATSAVGGTMADDTNESFGWFVYQRQHAAKIPEIVVALENFGRLSRLLEAHVPVTVELNVDTLFTGDHEHGFDTIAEIPGVDPTLRGQVVMLGGHLDSWIAGTGATDDGAGAIIAMEVMRILRALDVHPHRTIRVALWSGEEQGLFGSAGYVKQHFGSYPFASTPEQLSMPEFVRRPGGPLTLKPEQKLISAYYNIDNGGGKLRGIFLQQNAAVEPIFAQWIEPLKDLGVTTLTMRDTGGTDHLSFDAVGIPGFQFIQDPLDYDTRSAHTNMDTYERLQPGDLRQAAVVEAIFVYNTAMRDQMLPRKPLPHPELYDQRNKPLVNVMPGAQPEPTPAK